MRAVRREGTGPEIAVRKAAHALGLRFRLHRKDLPGTPDLVFPKHRVCLFVHGCFWHRHPGCSKATTPKTRRDYWIPKFEENVARDARVAQALHDAGWRVETIWECETRDPIRLRRRLAAIFRLPQAR